MARSTTSRSPSPAPRPRRPLGVRVLRAIAFTLLGLFALIAALVAFVFTPPGREALRGVLNAQLRRSFQGQLSVGAIPELRWNGPLRATGLTLRDPQGRLVVTGGEVTVASTRQLVSGLWRGLRRKPDAFMPPINVHLHTVRIYPGREGPVSIADAFASRTPAPATNAPGPPFLFRRLDVAVDRVENHVGNFDAVATGVRARGGVVTEPLALVVDSARTVFDSPRTPSVSVQASFVWRTETASTGSMRGAVDLTGPELACHAEFERAGTRTHAVVRGCRASAAVIDRAAGQQLGIGAEIAHAEVTQVGTGPYRVTARGAVNAQPFELAVTAQDAEQVTADLTVNALDLARVRANLPPSEITGTVHAERRGNRFALDTSRLRARVQDIAVPPLRAAAVLEGRTLVLEQLEAPGIGLTAQARVNLDRPTEDAQGELHLHTADVGRVPVVGAQAPDGRVDLDVTASARDGALTATVNGSARGLRLASGARLARAEVRGTLTQPNASAPLALRAAVDASGVVVGNVGPVALRATVAGDPLRALDGALHADGLAPLPDAGSTARGGGPAFMGSAQRTERVTIDSPFHVAIRDDAFTVRVPRAAFTVRGAAGTAQADVRISRRGAPLAVRAHLATGDSGQSPQPGAASAQVPGGAADITVRGDAVSVRVAALPAAWVGRVAGLSFPLRGTLEGDLDLLTRRGAGLPRGTIAWRGGHLPGLGAVDLSLRAAPDGALTALELALDAHPPAPNSPPQTARISARVAPPANLGDADGWVRGLRDLHAQIAHLSLTSLEAQLAPAGTHLTGTLDARLDAARREPGAPLVTTLGLDVRTAQLTRSLAQDAPRPPPAALRPLLGDPNNARIALTDPLRVRGAVCTELTTLAAVTRAPLALDLALGREVGEPVAPLPTNCTPPEDPTAEPGAPLVRDPLAQARGALAGAWYAAVTGALEEYRRAAAQNTAAVTLSPATRRALAAANARMRVTLGPLASDRWPTTAAARRWRPALAPPRALANAQLAFTLDGALDRPEARVEARVAMADLPQVVGRDQLAATVRAHLAPARAGALTLEDARLRVEGHAALRVRGSGGARTPGGGAAAATRSNGVIDAGAVDVGLDLRAALARLAVDPQGALPALLAGARFELVARDVALEHLAWSQAHGGVAGRAFVRVHNDAPTDAPAGDPLRRLVAEGAVVGLRAHNSPPAGVAFAAHLDRTGEAAWRARACATVENTAGRARACTPGEAPGNAPTGGLRAALELPLTGAFPSGITPQIEGLTTRVVANRVRLEPFAPLVEGADVTRLGGELTADLAWEGAAPRRVRGRVELARGTIALASLGLPAQDVSLLLTSDGARARLERLSLRMGPGTLTARGEAAVQAEGPVIANATLTATADRLEVAQEGNNYGLLSTRADITAVARTDGLTATLRAHAPRLAMPDAAPQRDIQALEPDPDVIIVGRVPAAVATARGARPYPLELRVVTEDPMIVTRDDLFIVGTARLTVRQNTGGVAAGPAIGGAVRVTLRRSWVELLGKRFYLERANVRFTGTTEMNPYLDVIAHHDAPSVGRIVVRVAGRLSAPDITFASEQYPEADQSEVLAMLVLGRRDARGPGDQANVASQAAGAVASLVAGFGLGFVNRAARENLPFVPRLIVQPGAGGGRYGAGLTGLSGRLYVEGTFGASSSNSVAGQGGAAQEFGGRLEYSLSPHWSIGGQYGSLNRFGADIFWLPLP